MANEVFILRKRIQELEQALLPFASFNSEDNEGNGVEDIKVHFVRGAGASMKYMLGADPKKVLLEAKHVMRTK
jgi:hypothetical protein